MPSGAKKRKAFKKKQKNKPSTSKISTAKSVGDENLKHHESEGEVEELVEKSVEGEKSVRVEENESGGDKRLAKEEGGVQIQRESEADEKFDKKGDSSSSGGSSSSSDDENPVVEKDIMVIENAPVVQAVDSLSEGLIPVSHTTPVSKIDNPVGEAASDVHVEKVSAVDCHVPDNTYISDSAKSELNKNGERKLGEGSSASADNNAVKSELKENGERKLSSLEESSGVTEVASNMAPEHKKDEVSDAAASSDAAHDSEDKLMQSYSGPRDDTKDGEHVNDSEVLGSSTGERLIASAPRPVQTTSFKSCCGLFEVFAGSSR